MKKVLLGIGLVVASALLSVRGYAQSFTISPDAGTSQASLQVTITGSGLTFGRGSDCQSPACVDLEKGLLFTGGSPTATYPVAISDLHLVGESVAEGTIQLPYSRTYEVALAAAPTITQPFTVTPKPAPSVSIYPTSGQQEEWLRVSISGDENTTFSTTPCQSPCVNLGDGLFFAAGSGTQSTFVRYATLKITDQNHAEASLVLPQQGYYWLLTSDGVQLSNVFVVNPKPVPTFDFYPASGQEGTSFTTVIHGNLSFAQTSNNVGNGFYYRNQLPPYNNGYLPFTSVTKLSPSDAEVQFMLPRAGSYAIQLDNDIVANNLLEVTYAPAPTVSITPNSGIEGTSLTVSITGNGTTFGKGKKCANNPSCTDLANAFTYYFSSASSTVTGMLPFTKLKLVDSTHAEATIVLPAPGTYQLFTANGLRATDYLYVNYKPQPTLSISPAYGTEGTKLTVSITGTDINLKQELGNYFSYFTQGTPTSSSSAASGTLPFTKVKFLDQTHAEATFVLPTTGIYRLLSANSIYVNELLQVVPKPAGTFEISPATGEELKPLEVTITGSDVDLRTALGTAFYYFTQGSGTTNRRTLPFDQIKSVKKNTAVVVVTFPEARNYYLSLDNGAYATNGMHITPKPQPSFAISPATGYANEELEVTITGTNTDLYQGLGDGFIYFRQSSPSTSGTLPFIRREITSPTSAKVTIALPEEGLYALSTANGLQATNLLEVLAQISGAEPTKDVIVTGIASEASASSVHLYPNPTKDEIHVPSGYSVRVLNQMGETVLVSDQEVMQVAHLPAGLYIVQLSSESVLKHTLKFVKE